jgi:hypothetical protein
MPPVLDGANATRRGDVVEVDGGGGGVGATSGVFVATLVIGAVDGGSVGIGVTIGRGSGAGVGDVAGIERELVSQSGDGVVMGTVGGTGTSEWIPAGGSVGT